MANATKKIKIDFYQVECPDGADFAELIESARKRRGESRTIDIGGRHIRLHEVKKAGADSCCEMVQIRMDAMPSKASLDGDIEAFDLEDDEGVGEETAFRFAPKNRILVAQRNRFGVSSISLCRYFERAGQLDSPIILNPILEPAAYQRFTQIRSHRKLELSVAGFKGSKERVHNMADEAPQHAIAIMEELSAPSMQITLSMGMERKSFLDWPGVKAVVDYFRQLPPSVGEVNKILVSGLDAGLETQVVDLIEDRMVENADISLDSDRRLPYRNRRAAIDDAWEKRKSQVHRIVSQQ